MSTLRDALAAGLADALTKDWPGGTRQSAAPLIADYLIERLGFMPSAEVGVSWDTGYVTRFAWDLDEYWQPLCYLPGRSNDAPAKRLRQLLEAELEPDHVNSLLVEEQKLGPALIEGDFVQKALDGITEWDEDAVPYELTASELDEISEITRDLADLDPLTFRHVPIGELKLLGRRAQRSMQTWAEDAFEKHRAGHKYVVELAPPEALQGYPQPVIVSEGQQTLLEDTKEGSSA